jgi:hypothetical protein
MTDHPITEATIRAIREGRCPRCGRPLVTSDGQRLTNAEWPLEIAARMFCGDCGEERRKGQ